MKQNFLATSLRSHTLGELRETHIHQEVSLTGWVHRRRDHGGLIFIDLRDKYGITQVVFDPSIDQKAHEGAEKLRSEYCIRVQGKVRLRGVGLENKNMATGKIEIEGKKLDILSASLTPPFAINDDKEDANEDLKLTYRYLDLRRASMQKKLWVRNELTWKMRQFFHLAGFEEVETPILTKSTPEGARDYIVPSRIHPGHFYALPQSPQIYKQLCMIAGLDRYFQIARCFRDEDLRADRQPEFTQIDVEMSFIDEEDIFTMVENMIRDVFTPFINHPITFPLKRISYKEAMEKYGTDRPDIRFGLELSTINDIAAETQFSIFHQALEKGEVVKCFVCPQDVELTRREIDSYGEFVQEFGLGGLAWTKVANNNLTGNIAKFFPKSVQKKFIARMNAQDGDVIFYGCGKIETVNQSLDHLRRLIAEQKNLTDENMFAFLWVQDFPLFEIDNETGSLTSVHHPFTAPKEEDVSLLHKDPLKVRARAYDLVLNGIELGGGSIRIHDTERQNIIFTLLNLSESDIKEKFGFLLTALKFGAPVHGGIAFGLDRIAMLLARCSSIREVILFPKTQKAADIMMGCPSRVHPRQLKDLSIYTND